MSNMKKFVISEIDTTIKRQIAKKKIKESSKNLYDAVSTASSIMTENVSEKKRKLSEIAIALAEKNLRENYDELDSVDGCDCEEGEGEMLKAQLLSIMSNAKKLYHMIDEEDQFEDWIQSKITIAEDYLRAAYGYLTYFNGGEDVDDDFEDEDDEWDEVDEEDIDMDDESDDEMEEMIQYNESLDPNIDDFMPSKNLRKINK